MHYDFKKDSKYINFLLEKMKKGIISTEEYRYLQYLLMKYEFMYTTDYPLCQTSVTGDKILFTCSKKNFISNIWISPYRCQRAFKL